MKRRSGRIVSSTFAGGRRGRLRLLAAGLALGLCGPLLSVGPAHAVDPGGREEQLAESTSPAPSIPNFGTTAAPDGSPVAIVVAGGESGWLNVVDLQRRTVVKQGRFADTRAGVQPWGFATLSDGRVFVASGEGELYSVDPRDDYRVTHHAAPPEIKRHAKAYWDVAVDEQDRLYLAAEGPEGGHVIVYEPKTGTWRSLLNGPVRADNTVVRSVAYEGGVLYAGLGAGSPSGPSLHRIEVNDGTHRRLQVPAEPYATASEFDRLEVRAGRLYLGTAKQGDRFPCNGTCVLDPASGARLRLNGQEMEVPGWSSSVVVRPGQPEKVYYYVQSHGKFTVQEYDPARNRSDLVFEHPQLAPRLSPGSWASPDVFVSSDKDSDRLTVYDARRHGAADAAANLPPGAIAGGPRQIQAMTALPNGELYASWYMTARSLLRISPNAPGATGYELPTAPESQAEGFGHSGTWFVAGAYPAGALHRYRLGPDGRPVHEGEPAITPIGHGQARPYEIEAIDENLFAVGSMPAKGHPGSGALSLYDAAAGTVRVFPLDSIPTAPGVPGGALRGQTPISIVHRDGVLYVGTTLRTQAGPGQIPQGQPKLFAFDLKDGVVTAVSTPIDTGADGDGRQKAIRALVFDDRGRLFGNTGSHVFEADPATLRTVRSQAFRFGYPDASHGQLLHRDGVLYGVAGGRVYAIRADDFSQITQIVGKQEGEVSALTLGADGNLYYARGSRLFRYVFPGG